MHAYNSFLWTEPEQLTDKGLRQLMSEFRHIRAVVASYDDHVADRTCREIDDAIELLRSEAARRGLNDLLAPPGET